MQGDNIG